MAIICFLPIYWSTSIKLKRLPSEVFLTVKNLVEKLSRKKKNMYFNLFYQIVILLLSPLNVGYYSFLIINFHKI
jgi:hypothetical protein